MTHSYVCHDSFMFQESFTTPTLRSALSRCVVSHVHRNIYTSAQFTLYTYMRHTYTHYSVTHMHTTLSPHMCVKKILAHMHNTLATCTCVTIHFLHAHASRKKTSHMFVSCHMGVAWVLHVCDGCVRDACACSSNVRQRCWSNVR